MLQLLRKSNFDIDNFNGKQISNRLHMYGETFIAVLLQVFALHKNKKMNVFAGHPVYPRLGGNLGLRTLVLNVL